MRIIAYKTGGGADVFTVAMGKGVFDSLQLVSEEVVRLSKLGLYNRFETLRLVAEIDGDGVPRGELELN